MSQVPCPPMPPQRVSHAMPTFQFPRSLVQPLTRPWYALLNCGFPFSNRLERHVVICGFPRSGTTLCQLMIEAGVTDIAVFGRERRALDKARYTWHRHRFLLTKRPNDIFLLDDIRDFYRERAASVRFILFVRDPRAVLTSIHVDRPNEFYVSVERWRAVYEHWKWACRAADVLPVRYEDLIRDPAAVQNAMTRFVGWTVDRPFEEFHRCVPPGFDTDALNGVRQLHADNCERWRQERFRDRIGGLLNRMMPDLPSALTELGYEANEHWTDQYLRRSA